MADTHDLGFAAAEHASQIFRNRHGTMFAARAADADNNLAFAFLAIMRDKKLQHIEQFRQERLRFRPFHHIIVNIRILARIRPQMLDIMRIRQKANIKDQISIDRNPIFKSEGDDIDRYRT